MSYKTSLQQYKIMLKFMQRHGDLCAPCGGGDGRLKTKCLWEDLTNKLNAVSRNQPKSLQKWTKIWSDWKARTKKKALSIHTDDNNSNLILTELECQLMVFLGWQVVVAEGNKNTSVSFKDQPDADDPALGEDQSNADDNCDSPASHSEQVVSHTQRTDRNVDNGLADNVSDPLSPPRDIMAQTVLPEQIEKLTQSPERHKKLKRTHKRGLEYESRLESIMEKYAEIEALRLEVELLKEKNEERRLAALEQSNNNQRQYMEFMHSIKGAIDSFLTVYTAKNS